MMESKHRELTLEDAGRRRGAGFSFKRSYYFCMYIPQFFSAKAKATHIRRSGGLDALRSVGQGMVDFSYLNAI